MAMSEMRLIDANALMKNIGKIPQLRGITYGRMKKAVEETPAVDAVPVVRCKDCKFRGFDFCPMCHDEYTYDEDDGGDYYTVDNTEDDGFCHNGAKMDIPSP